MTHNRGNLVHILVRQIWILVSGIFLVYLVRTPLIAQERPLPFSPAGTYDSRILSPDRFLGFALGQRPARYDEVVRYIKYLADTSPRARLVEMGETYEARKQYYLAVTSEENMKRVEEIRANVAKLADPRNVRSDVAEKTIDTTPAVVWIGYGIHGDEVSSGDAALQVAYQLVAGTDEETNVILKELVVCIDPMENPDGRERFLGQMQQWAGVVANTDVQSMQHSGVWPGGRSNHYLFDLNRDWFILTQVEIRNRIRAVLQWNPQVLIDSHEMGSYDTYLFSPAREPINPNIPERAHYWRKIFASDQAKAFDRYGWSYYTREWNDEWYPGYGSSWGLYIDAVGILYEQAGVDGSLVKRPDGTVLTYRETVHHHVVSSIANLTTAARNRRALLKDFHDRKKTFVSRGADDPAVFYLLTGKNISRTQRLVERLLLSSIDVKTADKDFRATDLHDYWGSKPVSKMLPSGTFIVPLDQPMGRLAKAILEFDPRMKTSFLQDERKSLEKEKDSKLYDVTAWSLPLADGVEAYWSPEPYRGASTACKEVVAPAGFLDKPQAAYGYLVDLSDDRSVEFLAAALEKGFRVRSAKEPFEIEGRSYARGTLLLRRTENPTLILDSLQSLAQSMGAAVHGVNTALSTKGPDLGGNDMVLLRQPRIALVGGREVSTTSLGALWYLMDNRLKLRMSILTIPQIASGDLRKYNVLVLPSGDPEAYGRVLGKAGVARLKEWIEGGGTVIAIGGAAAFAADTSTGLSSVRLRHQVLKELDIYAKTYALQAKSGSPVVDSLVIWDGKPPVKDTAKGEKPNVPNEKELALQDERGRLFMPRGCIMYVELDDEYWLCFGAGERVPAILYTSTAFLSKDPVRTAARFSDYERLRLSGLLWPEARERWARTAYATREAKGRGQIILFAGDPNFRASFKGTERILLNSLLLGPGFGTVPPVEW